jgi:hypothetical protein
LNEPDGWWAIAGHTDAPSTPEQSDNSVNDEGECAAPVELGETQSRYSHSRMTNDERMQRGSSLIATIRKEPPEFAKACADDTELVLHHQDAFAADYQQTNTCSSAWRSSAQVCVARKCACLGRTEALISEDGAIQ